MLGTIIRSEPLRALQIATKPDYGGFYSSFLATLSILSRIECLRSVRIRRAATVCHR